MKFLKKFNMSREIERSKMNNAINRDEKLMMYGLIGEERVYYQLNKIENNLIGLYNIRIRYKNQTVQFDYILVGYGKIIVLEVKNLFGNLVIKNESCYREINKGIKTEIEGIYNPVIQLKEHCVVLKKYLNDKNVNLSLHGIIVMANDKTLIKNETNHKNIIMYYNLSQYINNIIKNCENDSVTNGKVSKLFINDNEEYSFKKFKRIGDKMINSTFYPDRLNDCEYKMYLKVLEVREEYYKQSGLPIPYVFTNREAENLVLAKPKSKEEFIKVNGFKEKRYEQFGEKIIKIFINE